MPIENITPSFGRRIVSPRPRSGTRPRRRGAPVTVGLAWPQGRADGFTLLEVVVALSVVAIGFLGAYGMVLQGGKLASAAEEDALVCSGLEQRMDQLRELGWPQLTDGTGLTGTLWTASPASLAGISVVNEVVTISPYDVPAAQTLNGIWTLPSTRTVTFTGGPPNLSAANAVKVSAALTWTARRTGRPQTRRLVTVISKGGISKSVLP